MTGFGLYPSKTGRTLAPSLDPRGHGVPLEATPREILRSRCCLPSIRRLYGSSRRRPEPNVGFSGPPLHPPFETFDLDQRSKSMRTLRFGSTISRFGPGGWPSWSPSGSQLGRDGRCGSHRLIGTRGGRSRTAARAWNSLPCIRLRHCRKSGWCEARA